MYLSCGAGVIRIQIISIQISYSNENRPVTVTIIKTRHNMYFLCASVIVVAYNLFLDDRVCMLCMQKCQLACDALHSCFQLLPSPPPPPPYIRHRSATHNSFNCPPGNLINVE